MKKYIFYTGIILTIYFMSVVYNHADWDLWARLAVGGLIFKNGGIPKEDVFSYTQTKDLWVDHEWGSGVIFYFLADRLGDFGLVFLKFILIFLVFIPVYKLVNLRTGNKNSYRIIYYFLFFYAILFGFVNTIRAQCFTFAFFAWWIYWLELLRRGNNKIIWVFPLTTVIWANLHGGFLAGIGILLLYAIGEILNRKNPSKYLFALILSAIASLINPYGFEYWNYLYSAVTMPRPYITEWQGIELFGPLIIAFGFKIFYFITLFVLPYLFIKEKKVNWAEILILIVTCYLSFSHMKHNVLFVIASAAYAGYYFIPALNFYTNNIFKKLPEKIIKFFINSGNVLIYGLLIIGGVLTVIFAPVQVRVDSERFPVAAVKFIEENNLSGNLLVLFNWGSYALWKLYPQCLVAVDGRYEEVYTDELMEDVAKFHYVRENWGDLMKKYKADLILLDVKYPVFDELLTQDNWKIVYRDNEAAVFVPSVNKKSEFTIPKLIMKKNKDKFKTKFFN